MKARHEKFINEYIKNGLGNGTQAAINAGYSKKTAYSQANRLLKNAEIKAAIDKYLSEDKIKALVTLEGIITDLKEVRDRCMERKPVMEWDYGNKELRQKMVKAQDDQTGEIKEVGVWEFDAAGANKAIELMGKTIAAFRDKVEVKDTTDRAAALAEARKRVAEEEAKAVEEAKDEKPKDDPAGN